MIARIPVPDPGYTVHAADGRAIFLQINEIPAHVRQLPGRNSSAIYELIFKLNDVPAMGKLRRDINLTLSFTNNMFSRIC